MTLLLSYNIALSAAAVGTLYWSWKRKEQSLLAMVGWLFAAVSPLSWIEYAGPEFGLCYAVIAFALFAWVCTALEHYLQTGRAKKPKASQRQFSSFSRRSLHAAPVLSHVLRFVLGGPIAGLVSLVACALVASLLPVAADAQLAMALVLLPFIWGLLGSASALLQLPRGIGSNE